MLRSREGDLFSNRPLSLSSTAENALFDWNPLMKVYSFSTLKVQWNWVLALENRHTVNIWRSLHEEVFLWGNVLFPAAPSYLCSCYDVWIHSGFGVRLQRANGQRLQPLWGNLFRAGWIRDVCVFLYFCLSEDQFEFQTSTLSCLIIMFLSCHHHFNLIWKLK